MFVGEGKLKEVDDDKAIEFDVEEIGVGADIPGNYLGILLACAHQQKPLAISKDHAANLGMAAGRRDIRLDNPLIEAFSLLVLHDEQVASRKGNDVILQVYEDIVAFVQCAAAYHS